MTKPFLLTAVALLGQCAWAQDDKKPAGDWTFKGGVDTYYGFSSPNLGSGPSRFGRQFDTRDQQIRLAVAEVAIGYRNGKPGFGFSITPVYGDNPDIQWQADSTASDISRFLAEAYGTWRSRDTKLSVDFGKFYSWIGYEGQESWTQENYSRGILTTTGQPNYHFGLRITDQATQKLQAAVYVTDGWNQTVRPSPGESFGASLTFTPNDKTTANLNVIAGPEGSYSINNGANGYGGIGFPQAGISNTTLYDGGVAYDPNPRLHLALDAFDCVCWGSANSGAWYGLEIIAKQQLGHGLAAALRLESMADPDGLRFGPPNTMQSASIDLSYHLDENSLIRLEYRVDQDNQQVFTTTNGASRDQKTFNLSYAYRF